MPENMIPLLEAKRVERGDIVRHKMRGEAWVVDAAYKGMIIAMRTRMITPASFHEYLIMERSPVRNPPEG